MPTIGKIARAILLICVLGGVCWLLDWAIKYIGLPDPFNKVALAIVVLGGVFCLIGIILNLIGVYKWPGE